MTIGTTNSKKTYVGNGVQTVFPYDFLVPQTSDLQVYVDNVLQTITTDYTVDGIGNATGGNVTFVTAPVDQAQVILNRVVQLTQNLDLVQYDKFPAESVEGAHDKATLIDQQQQEQLDRAVKFSLGASTFEEFEVLFGPAAERAGKLWAFDSNGTLVVAIALAEDKAYRWAETDEDVVVENIGGQDRYSAKHWAFKAETIVNLPLTNKGDLLTTLGGGPNYTIVPVGPDGAFLVADSGEPSGLNWGVVPQVLPPIVSGDKLKQLRVNIAENAYELFLPPQVNIGAGEMAEDDGSGTDDSAERGMYGKQISMAYKTPAGNDVTAWLNGSRYIAVENHKTVEYKLIIYGVMDQAAAANVRFKFSVFKYGTGADLLKTTPDIEDIGSDHTTPNNNNNQFAYSYTFTLPADAGEDDELPMAIAVSRIAAAANEHPGTFHLLSAQWSVA